MSLFPPSTNRAYAGNPLAAWFLAAIAVLTVIPGAIHVFLADGGAGTIAGLDLSQNGALVIALFAWAGATQITFGLALLLVALRYRPLVPAMLALVLLERLLQALNGWLLKGGSGHHPPEHYAVLVAVPLIAVALWLSLRPTRA